MHNRQKLKSPCLFPKGRLYNFPLIGKPSYKIQVKQLDISFSSVLFNAYPGASSDALDYVTL